MIKREKRGFKWSGKVLLFIVFFVFITLFLTLPASANIFDWFKKTLTGKAVSQPFNISVSVSSSSDVCQCIEGTACVINSDCELNNTDCSGNVCDYSSMKVNAQLSTGHIGLNGSDLTLKITGDFNISSSGILNVSGMNLSTENATAGSGGILNITANKINVLGVIDFSGGKLNGDGNIGNGGSGGILYIYSGDVFVNKTINSYGGTGAIGLGGGGGGGIGGNVVIVSSGIVNLTDVNLIGGNGVSSAYSGNGGNLIVNAVSFSANQINTTGGQSPVNAGGGGNIAVSASNSININSVYSLGFMEGFGGKVNLSASNVNISYIDNYAVGGDTMNMGAGGDVSINGTNINFIDIENYGGDGSGTLPGNGGNVSITGLGNVSGRNIDSYGRNPGVAARGGDVTISGRNIVLSNISSYGSSSTPYGGDGGNVVLNATGNISVAKIFAYSGTASLSCEGDGGIGGNVGLYAHTGTINVTKGIYAYGQKGSVGGNGSNILFEAYDLNVAGLYNSSGGLANCPPYTNGTAGDISQYYCNSFVNSSASYDAHDSYGGGSIIAAYGSYCIDITPPDISLISPENNYNSTSSNVEFECGISDNIKVDNLALYVWNKSGSQIYINTTALSGTSNSSIWNYNFPSVGVFTWNCKGYDNSSNPNWGASNRTINITSLTPSRWKSIIAPEGVFEPYNSALTGTHVSNFSIRFVNLTLNADENLSCRIKTPNGNFSIEENGVIVAGENYSLNYSMQAGDDIVNNPDSGYLPWILKSCKIENSSGTVAEENISSRIYVHAANYWNDSEVTRAVACQGTPFVYFNNTGKCDYNDTLFALQMRNGNNVNETCFNNPGLACSARNGYCTAIFFKTCSPIEYFAGYSAETDDPNGYATFTVSFAGYSTPIAYTRYTNSGDGDFKLRLTQALSDQPFSITIYNLTNVKSANVYGDSVGAGTVSVTAEGDGTYNVAYNQLASSFTGTLDLVFNISFTQAMNENRALSLVIAYGTSTNQASPSIFTETFSSAFGLTNNNESETSAITNDSGVCGDTVNNDFDYISGWSKSYDCYDSDCNGITGGLQTNYFGSGKLGLCNYPSETNCSDEYDNDYNAATDCADAACNGSIGNSQGAICNYQYELNCSDGFNNDQLQLKDCELSVVASSAAMPSVSNGEYDCSGYCRTNNGATETVCNDNIDNDWDAVNVTSPTTGTANNATGAGIDCRWGGYFGIGTDYNPDEDCNGVIMSTGRCELQRETSCNDGWDNDFDHNAAGMPSANWNLNPAGYQAYFGVAYTEDGDHDDYDCALDSQTPVSESVNASWCFDGIDNNLDSYFFNGTGYQRNLSTGIDCADPTCKGVANPSNPLEVCLNQEYNATNSFFTSLQFPGFYCNNSIDDDADGATDCYDSDCYKQFDMCSAGPCYKTENVTWNGCADNKDNNYDNSTDCADSSCVGMIGSASGAVCGATETSCNDGWDNNRNGLTDCQDSACIGSTGKEINGVTGICQATETFCNDGWDNDGDGAIDCYDSDCNSYCGLSSISGTTNISIPYYSGIIALNSRSASEGIIEQSTRLARNNNEYTITMKASSSVSAQWTLGTANKKFDNSKFNTGSAYISGTGASTFDLTQTANGWIVESNAAHPSGYNITFHINASSIFDLTTYELTQAETGLSPSINNYINYGVVENIAPEAQLIEVSSENLSYGSRVQVRANISDNNALGGCLFEVTGADSFAFQLNTTCKATFVPTKEGDYTIKVTPIDYYSNKGSSIQQDYNLNLLPAAVSNVVGNYFYNSSQMLVINSTFNMASTDSLGNCEVLAKNDSVEISLGNFSATGKSCYSNSISLASLSDGLYQVYIKVTETTDNNLIKGNSSALFICNGAGGVCRYADFNLDGNPDNCPDLIAPIITVISPKNTTYNTTTLTFNVSLNEAGGSCKYRLDRYNSTSETWSNGLWTTMTKNNNTSFGAVKSTGWLNSSYAISFNCSDVAGNFNYSYHIVYFAINTSYVGGGGGGQSGEYSIAINYPESITYTSQVTEMNFSASGLIDSCWYSLTNGTSNTTVSCTAGTVTGITSSEGSNTWEMWMNTTSGNVNSSSVSFTITSPVGCPSGQHLCSDEVCRVDCGGGGGGGGGCSNECNYGDAESGCANDSSLGTRTCGNYDTDSCTDWSPWTVSSTCNPNQMCQNGACIIKPVLCPPIWECGMWGLCNGTQTRACIDKSICNVSDSRPEEFRNCIPGCTENWNCDWTSCANGKINATNCVDSNNCGTFDDEPTNQSCTTKGCIPNLVCSGWTECSAYYTTNDVLNGVNDVKGAQEKDCSDEKKCVASTKTVRECVLNVPIYAEKVIWCQENYLELYEKSTNKLVSRIKETEVGGNKKLDISLLTSPFVGYCDYCYDGVKDYDEEGLDCGGSCPVCVAQAPSISKRNWLYLWWILLLILLIFLTYLTLKEWKRRRALHNFNKREFELNSPENPLEIINLRVASIPKEKIKSREKAKKKKQ